MVLLFILVMFLDDFSFKPWRGYPSWTADLGEVLFYSFGVHGLEIITFVLVLAGFLRANARERTIWKKARLGVLLLAAASYLFGSMVGGINGVVQGGDFKLYLAQTRYLHLFPLYTFLGFTFLKDKEKGFAALKALSLCIMVKSWQALYMYYGPLEQTEAEYLVDHYYSSFVIVTVVFSLYYLRNFKVSFFYKSFFIASLPPLLLTYHLNDRRSALIGLFFGLFALALVNSKGLSVAKLLKKAPVFFLIALVTAALWPLFLKDFFESLGFGGGPSLPDYRDNESANLLHTATEGNLLGFGYGREFIEVFQLPNMTRIYPRYKSIPHNQVFATWAFGGPFAIAGMGLIFTMCFYFATKLYHLKDSFLRASALFALFFYSQYLIFTYADLAFQVNKMQFVAGMLFGAMARWSHDQGLTHSA